MNINLLNDPLGSIGYRRFKKGFYRFDSELVGFEHQLVVELRAKTDYSITASFGFRSLEADGFALGVLKRYGDSIFTQWHVDASECLTWFSIGELMGWYPGAARWQHQTADQELAAIFALAVASG